MSHIIDNKVANLSSEEIELLSLRHTTEHVLHTAMQKLYPNLKKAMGPATDEGFYFDFELDQKISEKDFSIIEAEMQKLTKADLKMVREEVSEIEAKRLFKDNPYKIEWINLIRQRGESISIYKMIDAQGKIYDLDLCSGPHIESTAKIKAFRLLKIAGAYWHGDEKNKMLTRIYGTTFKNNAELMNYLTLLEEAEKRDHRKIGRELELFTISEEVGPGLILWLPKGTVIKDELETWAKETEKKWGYQRVATPNITKSGLYYTSGHLPYYKEDMYPPMAINENEEYYLKPMNCPHHHMIYKAKQRSYNDLPLKLAEYGTCYRYESSGELYGMIRLRGFTQNDSHIYCTEEQAIAEFVNVMKLHQYYYDILGIKEYYLELALRDPQNKTKYHGNDLMWEKAEVLMRKAVEKTDIPMVTQIGNAAFYGPKIDFIIKTAIGKPFAASTNQIDLFMAKRFNLVYTDEKGKQETPVIIHRAPLGSSERFIGFLIEHYAGKFPLWLSPIQVKIIPIANRHNTYSTKINIMLKDKDIRTEIDDRKETMQAKIRDATLQKVPYMVIIGDKEEEILSVSVRTRDGENLGLIETRVFIDQLKVEIEKKH